MIEYKTPFNWRARFDGTADEWPMMWNSSNVPLCGQLIRVVKPHELQDSSRKVEPSGTACLFVGLYEHKGGKPDGSVIVIPLQKMLECGKISFLRTKDYRLPKTLQFPMKTLSSQLRAQVGFQVTCYGGQAILPGPSCCQRGV